MTRLTGGAVVVGLLLGGFLATGSTGKPAQQVLAQARQAIGGDARLQAVKSLSLKGGVTSGTTARPGSAMAGLMNLQIDVLLPDRFLISREAAYFRRQGGFNWKELIERRYLDGSWTSVRPADPSSDAYAWQLAARRRECALYLVAWLLGAPAEYEVKFVELTGGVNTEPKADVVDVTGANDLAIRLFFDKATHRLAKLIARNAVPDGPAFTAPADAWQAGKAGPPLFKSLEDAETKTGEVTMAFTDHSVDGGILFPHKIRIDADGLREEWEISRFKVNPPLDVKYFDRR